MLNLRLSRGPLRCDENEAILREYNRLTASRIPMDEFLNWVQKSPAGPAWHAILESDEGRIVGHTSLFPFRTEYRVPHLTPAKSEYSFLHEDFRKEKIRGFENASRAAFVVLLDQLFQHCQREGWGPIFASTNEKNQAFTRRIGLQPAEFPVWECLFVLRPLNAVRHTPNLTPRQRALLLGSGISQRTAWSLARLALSGANGVRTVPVGASRLEPEGDCLSFFEDLASLRWRYIEGQYARFSVATAPEEYLIAKKGTEDRYLRVCQWRLDSPAALRSLIIALIRQAAKERALGVRWAVYDNGPLSMEIVKHTRRMGFLCARRVRTVMVHKKDPEFLSPAVWKMNDSLFSFDP
jgi:hypothetical protein